MLVVRLEGNLQGIRLRHVRTSYALSPGQVRLTVSLFPKAAIRPHSRIGARTQCERLILTGLRGRSAPLFDRFPSRRPHNVEKLWFSKALLRMMINPRSEHTPQYLCLFYLSTFAFCN